MLAAQGYQESGLDQNARSHVGAIGVMQVMPATGAQLKVGDIRITEPNIHAGAKYMDQLMSRYFPDARFDEMNRSLFAFAAYNAGPGRIARLRKEAEQRGLDPDRWFNNVEIVTAEKVGSETTTYVAQHLQILLGLQADARRRAGAAEGAGAGRTGRTTVRIGRPATTRNRPTAMSDPRFHVGRIRVLRTTKATTVAGRDVVRQGAGSASHVASGSKRVIAFATEAVAGPRFFWYTTPSWLIRNDITPVSP